MEVRNIELLEEVAKTIRYLEVIRNMRMHDDDVKYINKAISALDSVSGEYEASDKDMQDYQADLWIDMHKDETALD